MTYQTTICPDCLAAYTPKRWDQRYCSAKCNEAANNEAKRRGAEIYALAYHWRFDRANAKASMRAMCRLIAGWREADAGKALPPLSRKQVELGK